MTWSSDPVRATARVAALVTAGIVAVLLQPHAASAEESPERLFHEFSLAEIEEGVVSSESDQGEELLELRLDSAARDGSLLDTSEVHAAIVEDPTLEGAEVRLVWDSQVEPAGAIINRPASTSADEAAAEGFAVKANPSTTQVDDMREAEPDVSSGYGTATQLDNLYVYGSNLPGYNPCIEVWFDAAYTDDEDHYVKTCFEKLAEPGTRNWVYNRWVTANHAESTIHTEAWTDFTIRTRPYEGYENRISSMPDMSPSQPAGQCDGSISFGTPGGSFAYSTGVDCTNVQPINVGTQFGLDFSGTEIDDYMRMDAAAYYIAADAVVVPVFSDYVWATVCFQIPLPGGVGACEDELWTDGGW